MIPTFELNTQYAQIQEELEEAVLKALRSTHYILGQEEQAFTREFADRNDTKYGIGVANGTDALQLALRAVGVGPGDEVIVPSFTFVATAGAAALTGATPIFADIDADTFTINLQSLESLITERTKAIVVVHLYGHPAPVLDVVKMAHARGIKVIEDCAQAFGSLLEGRHVGSMGDAGCYSFFPTKNLGGVGDGGIVITNDESINENLLMLRGHGSKVRYYHEILGTNSRLDEIQAAALRVKLRHVSAWNEQRRAIAAYYNEGLKGTIAQTPIEKPGCKHVYHQYTVRVPDRDRLHKYLAEQGIGSAIYYPVSLHLQKTFLPANGQVPSLPVCEQIQKECLSLPIFPELTHEQMDAVIAGIKSFKPQIG